MILDDIVARKKQDLEAEKEQIPVSELEKRAQKMPEPRDFYKALFAPGLSIIAEVKRASPSKGLIVSDFDPVGTALQYASGGASAVSVLTEKHFFMGNNQYLTDIKSHISIPVLRKDFIIDERQVIEARVIGADAILLIAAILEDAKMAALFRLATDFGLHCLFEAHIEEEVKRIVNLGAKIVGINNRNLSTFQTDLAVFENLVQLIPKGCLAVAESGIHTAEDALRMQKAGADALLVGESLMKSENIQRSLQKFRG